MPALDSTPYPPQVAHPRGKTYLQFTRDGKRMLVAGTSNYVRCYQTNDDAEADMIQDVQDDTLAMACGDDYVILGAANGTVCEYSITEGSMKSMLVRSTLPVRSIALSPDAQWIAVSSDEIEVKVVNRQDNEKIHVLKDFSKPVKHISYDPKGRYLSASCTDGKIYLYKVRNGEPQLLRAVDGIIQRLETVDEASSECVWHPDGEVFACATSTRDIVVVSADDGRIKQTLSGAHNGKITTIAWSPNGAVLASAAMDNTLALWDMQTRKVIMRKNYEAILDLAWHNQGENLLCWTTSEGEIFINPGFLQNPAHIQLLSQPMVQPIPTTAEPAAQPPMALAGRPLVNGRPRAETPDSLEELLGPNPDADEDDERWIVDDDGAGYKNTNGKRPHNSTINGHSDKRNKYSWQPQQHAPFQPGETPYMQNKKWLCHNLTGLVWTADQGTHSTVTVEFYDKEAHRNYHFTDPFGYNKACITEHGALFASSIDESVKSPAVIFYRPHETWTNRQDFRTILPDGEDVSCIALSNRYVVACTSVGYVRVWTLFGTPVKVWRMKSLPAVTCSAYGDHVMTVGNGPVDSDGHTQLIYTIDDIRHDEVCQSEDVLPLGRNPQDEDDEPSLRSLFWSEEGDPCIYDSTGVCLVLLHWRTVGQAKWVPLLDTTQLDRLKDGKKQENYWPVAVADGMFHCIVLKGADRHPPLPPTRLLHNFAISIPVGRDEEQSSKTNGDSQPRGLFSLEESYVRNSVLLSLLDDQVQSLGEHAGAHQRNRLRSKETEVDKTLLQLLGKVCGQGEDQGMKALELVHLLHDRSGQLLDAATKIAGRFGQNVLQEKIHEVGERRMNGMEEE